MRTVEQFPSEAAMLVDVCRITATLEALGWRPLTSQSDTLIQDTWQHDTHRHDIVVRWVRNINDDGRWDRRIELVWWRWPEQRDDPATHTFPLPTEVPVEAAAGTFDGQPITLATIIAMTGVCDIREVA